MSENIDFAKIIKSKINIVDYISKDLRLTRSGSSIKALCPFHKEKTPSFTINENKETYRCFGCGKAGDLFSYVMEKYKINFRESIKILANEAGVDINKNFKQYKFIKESGDNQKNYFGAMNNIATYYHQNLIEHLKDNSLSILKEKNITNEIIVKYKLGLSSNIEKLINYLLKNNVDIESLVKLGVFKVNKNGNKYDMFTNRLMFPIRDRLERVIGFGGRSLDGSSPKYINSSENNFFKKRNILYNMNNLKMMKTRDHNLFIVEGYTDVIAMEQNGYNAVAPLGTAISLEQIKLTWKYVNEPNIIFDGDKAGINATYRALDVALFSIEPEKTLNFIFLAQDEDPDSLLKTNEGKIKFQNFIKSKSSLIETIIKSQITNNLDTPERVLAFKKKLLNKINNIKNTEIKNLYKLVVGEKIKESLRKSIKVTNYTVLNTNKDNQFIKKFKNRKEEQFVLRRERSILGAMMNNFNLLRENDEILAELYFSNKELSLLRDAIIDILSQEKVKKASELKSSLINKGLANVIKNHFVTEDCIKFQLKENYAKESTNISEAKKALLDIVLLQEKWYEKQNKSLSKISQKL